MLRQAQHEGLVLSLSKDESPQASGGMTPETGRRPAGYSARSPRSFRLSPPPLARASISVPFSGTGAVRYFAQT